jgi:DNA invertase Pin-like site-specific DNA recombinase
MARKSRKNTEATPEEKAAQSNYNHNSSYNRPTYKVAAYIRLSVEDNNRRGDSLDTQKNILQNYLTANPELRLHDYYVDNGTTGTNFSRPAFQKMLSDAEDGVINCIIVKDLSRFGRNVIDTGYYIEKYLPSIKVRFIAVTDDFDSHSVNPADGIMLPLKNMINEAYSLDIGRKIKAQQRQAMQAGDYVGGRPPYGYLKHPDNCHKLIIDPDTAPVVQQIFEWAYQKAGLEDMARRLNEAGVITPSYAKKAKGLITNDNLLGNSKWQTRTIAVILSCETYTGDLVQGKSKVISHKQVPADKSEWIVVRNTHEPIISREIFNAVQTYREQIKKKAIKKPKTPFTPNIFKSKIICGYCGGHLHRRRQKLVSKDVYWFICLSNSRIARGTCPVYSITEEGLLSSLLAVIQKHADVVVGKTIKLRDNKLIIENGRTKIKSELTALRQETDKDSRLLKSLYESLVSGIITQDEYKELRAAYEKKITERLNRINALESRQYEFEAQMDEYLELSDLIGNVGNCGDITAAIINKLIGKIQVFSDRSIEVDFRFNSGFERIFEVVV